MHRPLLGDGNDDYTGFYLDGIEEWSQFFTRCNWRTFHPVMFEIEDDSILGGFEVTVILFGLGFRARINYAKTEMVNNIKERVKEILED